jgi:cytochrome c peroxidase
MLDPADHLPTTAASEHPSTGDRPGALSSGGSPSRFFWLSAGAHRRLLPVLCLGLAFPLGCGDAPEETPTPTPVAEFDWQLPPGFPAPVVPEDNPMNASKVELGRYLFYDRRLSANQTQSCGDCHLQSKAFTDGKSNAIGSTGDVVRRSSMNLTNAAYFSAYTWVSPVVRTLEQQAMLPLFNESPIELGMAGQEAELVARLLADQTYQALFPAAFPDESDPVTVNNAVKAIAAFERTLISGNSPYDRYIYQGDRQALSESARRGLDLFFSEKVECFHCHGSFIFSDSVVHSGSTFDELYFHNTGLYNVDGNGAYPASDQGLIEQTYEAEDMGRFRAPTLRNIELTAPYMHDGSVATLEDVLDHYSAGGRTIESGENAGVGSANPYKSEFMVGFTLSEEERADLIAFLQSLTDTSFTTDPRFSNPFED